MAKNTIVTARKGILAHVHRAVFQDRPGYPWPRDRSIRSNTVESIVVVGPGIDRVFEEGKDCPAYELVQHVRGCVSLVPLAGPSNKRQVIGPMASGNFATGDSRFSEAVERVLGHSFYGAVAIHDSYETQERYDANWH